MERRWIPGQRVLNEAEPDLGLGTVKRLVDHRNVEIWFGAAGLKRVYNARTAPLRRVVLAVGQHALRRDGRRFQVVGVERRGGLLVYRGTHVEGRVPEADLADQMAASGAPEKLLAGRLSPASDFELREEGWSVRQAILSQTTRGLVGARVRLLPHQLYIAHKIAHQEVPRVLLADEVGLGKTIEAGLIFCGLRALGRASRVLILVPESLVHQWLAEMFRRFGEMFTLLDEERCQELDEGSLTAFGQSRRVICSLDFLVRSRKRLADAARQHWDLVVVDEAHHLEWSVLGTSPAYGAVERLSRASVGLLLLTATPMHEGWETEFGLLRLVDPDRFHDFDAFKTEQTHLKQVARLAAALAKGARRETLDALARLFPEDHELHDEIDRARMAPGTAPRELIQELVDRHGTGRVLIRNRRERLQGFPGRALHEVRLAMPRQWRFVYSLIEPAACDEEDFVSLVSCLLHLRPHHVVEGERLEPATLQGAWKADPRIAWLVDFARAHADEKIVLICSRPATVVALQAAVQAVSGMRTAVFHEGLSIVERDRQAAYFAAPDGASVLFCSEIGGEGRNFQFSHRLVLFDLPVHPDLLEQRIGRLDRIGQDREIQVYAVYVEDTPAAALLHWHRDGLASFARPVQGAEQVMQALRNDLLETLRAHLPLGARQVAGPARLERLLERTRRAIEKVRKLAQDSLDPLVDLNSFDEGAGQALRQAIETVDADARLPAFMERVLDRFGVVDEELDARGRRHIRPGDLMFVDAFPGLPAEGGIGATYRRDLALEREDLDFLSLDHPLVEGALSLLLDYGEGTASACAWADAPADMRGLFFQFLFVFEASGPPALELARWLPTTPLAVTVDHHGTLRDDVAAALAAAPALRSLLPEALAPHQALLHQILPGLEDAAKTRALAACMAARAAASAGAAEALGHEHNRLLELSRVNSTLPAEEVERHRARVAATMAALEAADVRLDAVRVVMAGA